MRIVFQAALLLGLAPLAFSANVLKKLELASASPQGAQLVLEFAAAPKASTFSLDHPDRVVIDLSATRAAANLVIPAAAGPLKSLRKGTQPGGRLRLVLELNRALQPTVRSDGTRLIVELGDVPSQGAAGEAGVAAPSDPAPASAPAVVRPAHAPGDAGRDIVVAIDAGHGGHDPGASGAKGTREKDVVLAIARALAKRVNAEPGMRAVLTRDDDRYLLHRDRMAVARRARADIFVSVHADSIRKRDVTGSSVYVLSDKGASSEAARWLAEQENAADLKGGVSLGDKDNALASVLMDLSQTASIGASADAAERVLAQLDRVGEIRKTQVQQANFLVLKSPDIPSMLVETAYISNPGEERKLRTPAHQAAVAEAIFKGVRDYFRSNPPDGTLYARQREARRGGGPVIAASTGR